jgi:hypothetical protein
LLALADQLRRVHWDPPAGANRIRFWPFGLPGVRPPRLQELFSGYRHLIMAPFVNTAGLDAVIRPLGPTSEVTVVSRPEELDRLPHGTLDGYQTYVIDPLAGLGQEPAIEAAPANSASGPPFGAVHAKVLVVERNHRARLFAGSANATQAAFGGNVELLCELEGGPSRLGVAALLGEDGFGSLLDHYAPTAQPAVDDQEAAGWELEAYLIDVAQLVFTMHAHQLADEWGATITTQAPIPAAPAGATVELATYNRPIDRHQLHSGTPARVDLAARAAVELTPFLLLSASNRVGGRLIERSAVVQAQLVGGPTDRLEEILTRQIDTPEKFLRLLLLLLGLGTTPIPAAHPTHTATEASGWAQGASVGVFELLVRALAVNPAAIDRLAGIVERLSGHDQGQQVLPPGWAEVWATVAAARQLLNHPDPVP